LGGRAVDNDQINPPLVCRRDLKSGSLCEYAGGPKVWPLLSQFFRFFIVEASNIFFTNCKTIYKAIHLFRISTKFEIKCGK
jgi:hypothetical protein